MSIQNLFYPNDNVLYAHSLYATNLDSEEFNGEIAVGAAKADRVDIGHAGNDVYINGSLYAPIVGGVTTYELFFDATTVLNLVNAAKIQFTKIGNSVFFTYIPLALLEAGNVALESTDQLLLTPLLPSNLIPKEIGYGDDIYSYAMPVMVGGASPDDDGNLRIYSSASATPGLLQLTSYFSGLDTPTTWDEGLDVQTLQTLSGSYFVDAV